MPVDDLHAACWAGHGRPTSCGHLRESPRRFSELKSDLQGVSAKTAQRAPSQAGAGRRAHRDVKPTSPPTVEYRLTALVA